jgi:hypothetical protein
LDPVKLESIKDNIYNIDLDISSLSANQKQKAEYKLSTNLYTIKAWKQIEALQNNKINLQIKKAKAANQGTITYIKKKLVQSA